jgi:hypothetical protein
MLVTVATAALGRLPVVVVAKADITEAATAATFAVEVAVAAAGVERFAAATIVVALDGKATSAFPDKKIQKEFASVRADEALFPEPWHST